MAGRIIEATSVTRAMLLKRAASNMLADVDSDIADFKDMKVGSLQAWYKDVDNFDSTFEVYVSDYPDPLSFGKYPKSLTTVDADCESILWNLGVLGFRYAFLRYVKGPTITTGNMEIIALGKK